MKWTGMYLLGYVIFVAGLFAALWKMGVLDSLGTTWTVIARRARHRVRHHDGGQGQRRRRIDVDHH